jgi:hypothetical protein
MVYAKGILGTRKAAKSITISGNGPGLGGNSTKIGGYGNRDPAVFSSALLL